MRERVRVGDELTLALKQGDLELYYQPQVELASGRITGLEALIRWNHETRGLLTPAYFITIAERTSAVLPIGRWVFEEACRQLSFGTSRASRREWCRSTQAFNSRRPPRSTATSWQA